MDKPKHAPEVWFVGDLDDPWVVAISESLPSGTKRIHGPGDLPDSVFGDAEILVLHRQVLTRHDSDRLRRFRAVSGSATRILLCHGPHVRYEDIGRWSEFVDGAIPEATAVHTLARHVRAALGEPSPLTSRRPSGANPKLGIAVVSANFALRQTLADAVKLLGFRSSLARDFSSGPPPGVAIWDVPWLEPDWSREIARRAERGPLIALLGFADRALVAEAHAQGAVACLELPLDLADLASVLDRVIYESGLLMQPAHVVPPAPALLRKKAGTPSVVDPQRVT